MSGEFSSVDMIVITILLASFTVMLALFMVILRYLQHQNKELISTVRDSYEKQIYSMNDRLMASVDRWRDVNHLLLSSQAVLPSVDPMHRVQYSAFLEANGVRPEDIEPDPALVFVLTPFNNRFDDVFERIRLTCQEVGLSCLRGDEQFLQGDILGHILRLLCRASVVIANIEGRNANVFYELGLAHALDKSTLLVAKTLENLPIDVKSKRIIVYRNMRDLGPMLKDELLKLVLLKRDRDIDQRRREKLIGDNQITEKEEMIKQVLCQRKYRLYFNPKVPSLSKTKIMRFGRSGEILEGRNANEDNWRVNNGLLELVDSDGRVHSRFVYDPVGGGFMQRDDPDSGTMRKHQIRGQFMLPEEE